MIKDRDTVFMFRPDKNIVPAFRAGTAAVFWGTSIYTVKKPACEFCVSFVYCAYVQRLYKTVSYRFGYFRSHRHYPALFGRIGALSEQYTQNDDAPLRFRSRRRLCIFHYFRQIDFKFFRHIAGRILHIGRHLIFLYRL